MNSEATKTIVAKPLEEFFVVPFAEGAKQEEREKIRQFSQCQYLHYVLFGTFQLQVCRHAYRCHCNHSGSEMLEIQLVIQHGNRIIDAEHLEENECEPIQIEAFCEEKRC